MHRCGHHSDRAIKLIRSNRSLTDLDKPLKIAVWKEEEDLLSENVIIFEMSAKYLTSPKFKVLVQISVGIARVFMF